MKRKKINIKKLPLKKIQLATLKKMNTVKGGNDTDGTASLKADIIC